MQTLKTAIIGTGFMSWVHLDALRRTGVQVIGMLGSSESKSRAAANQHGLKRAYLSIEEVLEDS